MKFRDIVLYKEDRKKLKHKESLTTVEISHFSSGKVCLFYKRRKEEKTPKKQE